MRLLVALPLPPQLLTVQGGERTPNLPKRSPSPLCLPSNSGVLGRDIKRSALAGDAIGNVKMRSVQTLGIFVASAAEIAATT
jgi:hypothetical protein